MTATLSDIDDLIDSYRHPEDSPASRDRSRIVLKDYFRALRAKDLEALRAVFTEDIVIEIPFNESGKTDVASYRVYRGVEDVLQFWAIAFRAEGQSHGWTETDMTVSADGSRVFLEWRGHLTMADGAIIATAT